MPTVSFDLTAQHLNRLIDAYAGAYGYTSTIDNGEGVQVPNPESKQDFARRMIKRDLTTTVQQYERNSAISTAVTAIVVQPITIT